MNLRTLFRGSAAALLLLSTFPIQAQSPLPVPPPGAKPLQPVARATTIPATPAEDPDAIRVLLSPEMETTLVSQMVGRISNLPVQMGSRVTKGKLVVAFDCSESSARLNMARAEYASANETLDAKKRLRGLGAAGDVEVSLASADAEKARATIALAQAQLTQCSAVAPFSGHVVKLHVKPHQGVNIGTPLMDIISDGPLKLRLNVPSRWLRQISVGTRFEVSINETGRTYPAKVTLINARVDAVAQTIELEARMDKVEPGLLAGMSGVARFKVSP